MHILYGVQATGQGHISRARAMAAAFESLNIKVTWLFSGRDKSQLFDMEPFENFMHRCGLTFITRSGSVKYLATLRRNKPMTFLRDVRTLDLTPYDLVVTDYEPVTAWAARFRGVKSIGIGHQYAFGQGTPVAGSNIVTRNIMRHFAPVDLPLGLHWHPYRHNVLPPILDLPQLPLSNKGHILVYLPFEDQHEVTQLLNQMPWQRFVQYANGLDFSSKGNVLHCPASTTNFKQHLASCAGVICNSGFELISECLQWQKPVLTKPLAGQTEQLSNAAALQQLGIAHTLETLSSYAISVWLAEPATAPKRHFPDVAAHLAQWLANGANEPLESLIQLLWRDQSMLPSSQNTAPLRNAA